MEQVYTPKQDYKVLVRCFTYNQSKYIEDALNGFAMQQTNFRFVCLVMDDCSIDGEQEVIKSWMERECYMEKAEYVEIELSNIILVPHKSNTNCTFAFYLLKQNLYRTGKKTPLVTPWREHCEYEALCEGDDYWIAEDKLQKQAEYLDKNNECYMCFTNATVLNDNTVTIDSDMYSHLEEKDYTGKEILNKWSVPTASVLVRSKIFIDLPIDARFIFGDIILFLHACDYGTAHCINQKKVVYRRNFNGISVKHISYRNRLNMYVAIKEHFGKKYYDICDKLIAVEYCRGILEGHGSKETFKTLLSMGKLPKYWYALITILPTMILKWFMEKMKLLCKL